MKLLRLAAAVAVASLLAAPGSPPRTRIYAVLFSTGPAYAERESPQRQPGMERHVAFITGLHAEGVVPLGGPLFDDDERQRVSGILVFVKAGSREEARAVALREPLVETRVLEIASVREFLPGVGALQPDP